MTESYRPSVTAVAFLRTSLLDDHDGAGLILTREHGDELLAAMLALAEHLGVTACGSKEALVEWTETYLAAAAE